MSEESLTFRVASEKREALDRLAQAMDRDRTELLNAAIDAYLAVHDWQRTHIEEGLRQADAGEFAGDEEIARAFRR